MYLPIGTIYIPFTINNTVDRALPMDPCDIPAVVMQSNSSVLVVQNSLTMVSGTSLLLYYSTGGSPCVCIKVLFSHLSALCRCFLLSLPVFYYIICHFTWWGRDEHWQKLLRNSKKIPIFLPVYWFLIQFLSNWQWHNSLHLSWCRIRPCNEIEQVCWCWKMLQDYKTTRLNKFP